MSKEQWLRGCRRAERSYPTLEARGGGQEELPPGPRSGGCPGKGGPRELLHVQGQEGQQ